MENDNCILSELLKYDLIIFGEQNIKGRNHLDPYYAYIFYNSTLPTLLLIKPDEIKVEYNAETQVVSLYLLPIIEGEKPFVEYSGIEEFRLPDIDNVDLNKGNYLYFEEKDTEKSKILSIDDCIVSLSNGELTLDKDSDIFIERTMLRTNGDKKVDENSLYYSSIKCTAFIF